MITYQHKERPIQNLQLIWFGPYLSFQTMVQKQVDFIVDKFLLSFRQYNCI